MKLAFCLFNYFPYGGLQRDFLRIARECRNRGHEIHVYTMQWEGEFEPGFHLYVVASEGWQNHTRIYSFTQQLKSLLSQTSYDLIIGFNKMPGLDLYYAADVCYQARIRENKSILSRLLPRYKRLVALEQAVFAHHQSTEIMLISAAEQNKFVKYYQTEPERFHLLPPGIAKDRAAIFQDPSQLKKFRQDIRHAYQIADNDFLLLMVGSGFKTKGLDRAIIALAALPNELKKRCHLIVIGQDNPKVFTQLAQQLKVSDRLRFLGGRSDVAHFLLAADLLLHPAYHENTGTVLLEAAISALPVLTVDICGYAHYIEEGNMGMVLSSPFDQMKFNTALALMLESPEYPTWQANALNFGKTADIYRMPDIAATWIEQMAQRKKIDNESQSTNFSHLTFNDMMQLRGEIFRHQKSRLTQRITFADQSYFIKQHMGIGWKEILKNIVQLRMPIMSAKNEWCALTKLHSIGVLVPKVIAYAKRGVNPAQLQSYIVLQELTSMISLEEFTQNWKKTPPNFRLKRKLIQEIAQIARHLHQNGINHRDFYLCHFLLEANNLNTFDADHLKLYLIDLHRASVRSKVPKRWLIKDLAALLFSCQHVTLTKHDFFLFMKTYHADSLRNVIKHHATFWQTIMKRGKAYRDHTQAK